MQLYLIISENELINLAALPFLLCNYHHSHQDEPNWLYIAFCPSLLFHLFLPNQKQL